MSFIPNPLYLHILIIKSPTPHIVKLSCHIISLNILDCFYFIMGVTENLRRHGFEHQRNMEVEETGMKEWTIFEGEMDEGEGGGVWV